MNEQAVILFFLIFVTVATLFLYFWKAKKEIEYRKDERWKLIQNKSNNTANLSNYILIVLVAIVNVVTLYYDIDITFTLNRVLILATLFLGLRNVIELSALFYFDKRL